MNRFEFYNNLDGYLEHAALLRKHNSLNRQQPKNPRKDHKYLYIDKNGNYIYDYNKPVGNKPNNASIRDTLEKNVKEAQANKKESIQKALSGREAAESAAKKSDYERIEKERALKEQREKEIEKNRKMNEAREAAEREKKRKEFEELKRREKEIAKNKAAAESAEKEKNRKITEAGKKADEENKKERAYQNYLKSDSYRQEQAKAQAEKDKKDKEQIARIEEFNKQQEKDLKKMNLEKEITKMDEAIVKWHPGEKLDISEDARAYINNAIDADNIWGYESIEDYLNPSMPWSSVENRKNEVRDYLDRYEDIKKKEIDDGTDIKRKEAQPEIDAINEARDQIRQFRKGDKVNLSPEVRKYLEDYIDNQYTWPYKNIEDYLEPWLGSNDTRKDYLLDRLITYENEVMKKHGLSN